MPHINPADEHLTVINLFATDAPEKQDRLFGAMREIVDAAAYPGWISSTVHAGQQRPGTANVIQWRSGEDLEARYAGEEFRHRTLPLFGEMTTSIRLLQTRVAYSQPEPDLPDVEISPDRDDLTVIEVYGCAEADQDALVEALGAGRAWLREVPGYRSHTVLRGLAARGVEGLFVVVYSQWTDEEAASWLHSGPSAERVSALATTRDWNSYRVVHTRSAQPSAAAS